MLADGPVEVVRCFFVRVQQRHPALQSLRALLRVSLKASP